MNTLNQYLRDTRRTIRDVSGLFEVSGRSPGVGGREHLQDMDMASAAISPEMAFQNRRMDRNGQFLDFEVPSAIRRRAVWDWLQGLPDPIRNNPQELYVSYTTLASGHDFIFEGRPSVSLTCPNSCLLTLSNFLKGSITAQREDDTADPYFMEDRAESGHMGSSEPQFHAPDSTDTEYILQEERALNIGAPASPRLSAIHVQARPALAESSRVRNRVMQNLRRISGVLPRDAEDGPQVPADAPRIVSPPGTQAPRQGQTAHSVRRRQFVGTYIWTWTELPPRS